MLSQMGAEVTKVESSNRQDSAKLSHPPLYYTLNHNKKHLLADYSSESGRAELIETHIKEADVLIEQFRPGAMSSWKLSYSDLKAINPNLIYVSITGYGQSTPLSNSAGHDLNYLGVSGLLSMIKDGDGKPVVPGFQLQDVAGGAYIGLAALEAGLIRRFMRERKGGDDHDDGEVNGCHIDVDMTAGVLPLLSVPYSMTTIGLDHRRFNLLNGKTAANYAVYETSDGRFMTVGALESKFWTRFCQIVGKEAEWDKSQLQLMVAPPSSFPVDEVRALFKTKTRDEWETVFRDEECCVGPVLELEELENHPYHKSRESFVDAEGSSGGMLRDFSVGAVGGKKTINLPFTAVS
jgi:alpha-methylacyl-CoA racemase